MWYENKATNLSFKMVDSDCEYDVSSRSYMEKHLVIQVNPDQLYVCKQVHPCHRFWQGALLQCLTQTTASFNSRPITATAAEKCLVVIVSPVVSMCYLPIQHVQVHNLLMKQGIIPTHHFVLA